MKSLVTSELKGHRPSLTGALDADAKAFASYWQDETDALQRLPAEARVAGQAASRAAFLGRHAATIYDRLTCGRRRFLRLDELSTAAADLVPGLVPQARELADERQRKLAEKHGLEASIGHFFAAILEDEPSGLHLCHAMLLPRPEALARLGELTRAGRIDLGTATVERQGSASVVTLCNARYLNAEDEGTLDALEIAVDLALLDPLTEICVLRGATVTHSKYAGRRVFGAGINLTHLYQGRIDFLWYLRRDLGFVNKMFRGLAYADRNAAEPGADTLEKMWVAGVDTFAIGGACQVLLVCDFVIAGADAFMTLPARKEGIIPGMANLRLPRFVGDRIARQAIMNERRLDCDSDAGRLICDEVVPPGEVDAAIVRIVERLTSAGIVSAAGNRRALRAVAEPLDAFRRYAAVYAREQAQCHFSPALIGNLEKFWNAQNRVA